jgi:hypothetical protein
MEILMDACAIMAVISYEIAKDLTKMIKNKIIEK